MKYYIGKTVIHLNNVYSREIYIKLNTIDINYTANNEILSIDLKAMCDIVNNSLTFGELNLDNLNNESKKIILQENQTILPVDILNKDETAGVKTESNKIVIG